MSEGASVVVTGFGAVTPIGVGVDAYAQGLRSGDCGVGDISLFDASAYRSSKGSEIRGDVRTEAVRAAATATGLPLQTRYGRTALFSLAALAEALQMAGLHTDELGDGATGLAFGGCTAGTFESEETLLTLPEGQDYWEIVPPMELLITPVGTTADVLLTATGVRGPVTTISTACSSATNAVGMGMRWIQSGRADRVIVGGADGLCRLTHCGFNALRLVSPDRPRPAPRGPGPPGCAWAWSSARERRSWCSSGPIGPEPGEPRCTASCSASATARRPITPPSPGPTAAAPPRP